MINQQITIGAADSYLLSAYKIQVFDVLRKKAVPLDEARIEIIIEQSMERIFKSYEFERRYKKRPNLQSIIKLENQRIFREYISEDGDMIYLRILSPETVIRKILAFFYGIISFLYYIITRPFQSKKEDDSENRQRKMINLEDQYPREFLEEKVSVSMNLKRFKNYSSVHVADISILLIFGFIAFFRSYIFYGHYATLNDFIMVFIYVILSAYIIRRTWVSRERKNKPIQAVIAKLTLINGVVVPRFTILTPPKSLDFELYSEILSKMIQSKLVNIRSVEL